MRARKRIPVRRPLRSRKHGPCKTCLAASLPISAAPRTRTPRPTPPAAFSFPCTNTGKLVLWPWWDTYSAAPNAAGLEAIGRKFAAYNGYATGAGASGLYHASGTADDWIYGTLGVPSFTFEMGGEFMPPYETVDETLWPENFGALVYAAKLARTPYATVLGPDANQVTVGRDAAGLTVSATIDDTANGGQPVAAAEYYVDTPPWDSGAVPHALAAVDGAFDGQIETVAATLSAAGIAAGRHVIYVRGQDALGHWGPFSAGLLEIRSWQNPSNPLDVDGIDGVQASDVLILVNSINQHGIRLLPASIPGSGTPPPFWDVTGDNWLTPDDVLHVVNHLNARVALAVGAGEGEMIPASMGQPAAAEVDLLMAAWAAAAPPRVGMAPTARWADGPWRSREGSDSTSARTGEGLKWNPASEGHLPRLPARTVTSPQSPPRLGNPRQAIRLDADLPLQLSQHGGLISLVSLADPVAGIALPPRCDPAQNGSSSEG
jgi:hypothetical protein